MRRALAVGVSAMLVAGGLAGCERDSPGGASGSGPVQYPTKTVQLMVPAAPGGGWDLTGRTMQKAFTDGKLIDQSVEVYNVTGAAGTIGLAQLVSKNNGDPHHLMVMGLVMVGGVVSNKSPVKLDQITPIATLTAEQEVIVVPANSKYQTLKQLMDDAKANPATINWGGGSAGGTDQILVGLLAKAAGADPKAMKYVAYSGGGESKAALLAGDLTAAVSGQSRSASPAHSRSSTASPTTTTDGVTGRYPGERRSWRTAGGPPPAPGPHPDNRAAWRPGRAGHPARAPGLPGRPPPGRRGG